MKKTVERVHSRNTNLSAKISEQLYFYKVAQDELSGLDVKVSELDRVLNDLPEKYNNFMEERENRLQKERDEAVDLGNGTLQYNS